MANSLATAYAVAVRLCEGFSLKDQMAVSGLVCHDGSKVIRFFPLLETFLMNFAV
jgi:hypothetical protein